MYQSVATITQLTQLQHKTHLAKNKQKKMSDTSKRTHKVISVVGSEKGRVKKITFPSV